MRVLGIAASLRNVRFGAKSNSIVADLINIKDQESLVCYIQKQTKVLFENVNQAGKDAGLPFDQIYKDLRKLKGERGLSNSEAALAAGMWGALQEGAECSHLSLADFFSVTGKASNLDQLKQAVLNADAILLSGPVYFGDRGSLAQSFFEFLASDLEILASVKNKIYAGLSVGAKRNGGQETTLVYQLLDMVNLDFFVVGNGSETTSQYGGTVVAGDVGTAGGDDYGMKTAISTGRRIARVGQILQDGGQLQHALSENKAQSSKRMNIQLWLLQDDISRAGRSHFQLYADWLRNQFPEHDFELLDFPSMEVRRCIACDICPTHLAPVEEYRCIITASTDAFVAHHETLIKADAVLTCAYSPLDRTQLLSVYQQFVERTRYLRRDDYALKNRLFAPFILSELSARQNLHLRMLTASMRHQSIVQHPILGMTQDGAFLNRDDIKTGLSQFVKNAYTVSLGRDKSSVTFNDQYVPIGYKVSLEMDKFERARIAQEKA